MMNSSNHSNRVSNLQGQSPTFFMKSAVPMEDTMSHDVKKQAKEPQEEQVADPGDSSEISSRQEQHLLLYILNLILTFCISFQNIPLVFTSNEQNKGYMSISILVLTICISMITTYNLCKDKWKIFNLYFLLDNIFLAQVASSFGFVGFLLVIYNNYWYQIITMMAFPIEIIFFVGNFRIMMLIVKWSKWKVILFKFVLLADSAVFFQIGAYYMSVNYQYTNGTLPELDGKVKDFVLLYIFGLFALFVEMYAKMCEIDQTNDLRFDYELKELQQAKQIERIRKSVITLNNEEKKKTQLLGKMKRMSKVSYLEVQQMKKS